MVSETIRRLLLTIVFLIVLFDNSTAQSNYTELICRARDDPPVRVQALQMWWLYNNTMVLIAEMAHGSLHMGPDVPSYLRVITSHDDHSKQLKIKFMRSRVAPHHMGAYACYCTLDYHGTILSFLVDSINALPTSFNPFPR
jgi:hypothetical protein